MASRWIIAGDANRDNVLRFIAKLSSRKKQRGKRVCATGSVDTFSGPVIGAIAYCEETTQTDCEGRTWAVNGDARANARLIAAAPDMLEALKALLACPAIADGGLSDPEWGCQESAEAVTKARAAIDKAERAEP